MNLEAIILNGLPTTTAYGGTFFDMTLQAPTTAPLPTVTPDNNVTFAPSHTSSSTITFFSDSLIRRMGHIKCGIPTVGI